jgi:hypothetical protein
VSVIHETLSNEPQIRQQQTLSEFHIRLNELLDFRLSHQNCSHPKWMRLPRPVCRRPPRIRRPLAQSYKLGTRFRICEAYIRFFYL